MASRAGRWLLLLVPLSAAAHAADDETLLYCRKIDAANERVACYDRVVDRTRETITPEAPAAAPRAAASEAPSADPDATLREQLFGRSAVESAKALRKTYGAEAPGQISSRAGEVRRTPQRLLELTLENGQVWRQEDYGSFPVRPGDVIDIKAGALGSYYLQRNKRGRTIRVARVR